MKKIISLLFVCSFCVGLAAQKVTVNNPVPSARQLPWQEMDYYFFVHFGPNTFTDLEWGKGTEPEDIFNQTDLDCVQWCRIAKAAGAKGIMITAKHHDGFCLWPSKYSTHTVAQSKWKNGKGDVLRGRELLVAEDHYAVLEVRLPDPGKSAVVERLRQVDSGDLGEECPA